MDDDYINITDLSIAQVRLMEELKILNEMIDSELDIAVRRDLSLLRSDLISQLNGLQRLVQSLLEQHILMHNMKVGGFLDDEDESSDDKGSNGGGISPGFISDNGPARQRPN